MTVERTGASLGVDEARRLVGLAQRRPFEASRQVLVVTDVHLAVRSAPALLKTIEEPPASTVFVLLADAIPPELVTVASRCVEVEFPPVPTGTIARWLEDRGVPAQQAALVAEGAAGDLGRARPGGRGPRLRRPPGALAIGARPCSTATGRRPARLARQLLGAADAALVPLKAHHAAELEAMAEEAKELGERGVPGRKEVVDRQHREERRWRTDELRIGLGVLARAYRDRLAEALSAPAPAPGSPGRGFAAAVDLITTVAGSPRAQPQRDAPARVPARAAGLAGRLSGLRPIPGATGASTGASALPGPIPLQPLWKGMFSNRWDKKA